MKPTKRKKKWVWIVGDGISSYYRIFSSRSKAENYKVKICDSDYRVHVYKEEIK